MPFHALLTLFLLLATATSALAQVPTKVTLSRANTPTADGFTVAWSDLSNETAYHLEHTTSANFTTSTLINNISANATSHALTGFTPGTTYYVRVRGAAAGGNGTWSDVQANQLLSIDPGQTRYLSVAGVPHGASHSVNFTISDIFGSANSAGLAADTTPSGATTIMLLGSDGSTAHTVFYNSSQNQWREGDTNKGSEIVGFGKGFMVKNNTGSADIFLLSGSIPPLEPGAVTVFDAGAPAGRLSLLTPSKTIATPLQFLGLTNSNNTTSGLKRATAAKDADLLLIPDSAGGLRRFHFDGTNWRSGLRTVADPAAVTVPAGGTFFVRRASGSNFTRWAPGSESVSEGLVLHFDAGNSASYPGSGTTWTDLSGNGNNATLFNGPTFSSSNGGSIVFDGINDYATFSTPSQITTNASQTWEVWCSVAKVGDWGYILHNNGLNDTIGNSFMVIGIETTTNTYFGSLNALGDRINSSVLQSQSAVRQVVVTYDGSLHRMYVDGSLVVSKAFNGSMINRDAITTIGGTHRRVDYRPIRGHIHSVKAYNRALSPAEVQQNFQATKGRFDVLRQGLVLNLDASNPQSYPGSGTTWTDLSGNGNNATLTNGPTFDSANGGTIVFDGSNDYVAQSSPPTSLINWHSGNFTLNAWFYANSFAMGVNSASSLIGNADPASNSEYWSFGPVSSSNKVLFYFWSGAQNRFLSNSTVSVNRWNHIAFTKNSSNLRIYINGSLDNSTTLGVTPQSSNTLPLVIGGAANGRFNGRISQVQIYDRALSAEDILYNYNVTRSRFDVVKEGLVVHLDAGNSASYPGNGTAWIDLTGSGNNGTLTNGPAFNSSNNGSILLDGSNDFVNHGTTLPDFTTQMSITFWGRITGTPSDGILVTKGENDGSQTSNFGFQITGSSALRFYAKASGQSYTTRDSNSGIRDNSIANYAVTFNSGTVNFYKNGALHSSHAFGLSTLPASTGPLYLGSLKGYFAYYPGNIYSVQIYNRALSTTEIQQNYNAARGRYGL